MHHDKSGGRGNVLRAGHGEGDAYHTHLLGKLLCLVANKIASLDPSGIGVEMEADKPNWYDALNGLPGLIGSSSSETFEIKRACEFVLDALKRSAVNDQQGIKFFEELADFIIHLKQILAAPTNTLTYWFDSNDAKEHYRAKIRMGINGTEKELTLAEVRDFLNLVIAKVDLAIESARNEKGQLATYFYHEVTEYKRPEKDDGKHVLPLKFKRHVLALFLKDMCTRCGSKRIPAQRGNFINRSAKVACSIRSLRCIVSTPICPVSLRRSDALGFFQPAGWRMPPFGCTWSTNLCWSCCAADFTRNSSRISAAY